MDDKFLKPYDSKSTESRIYEMWEKSGYFNPDTCIEKGVASPDADYFSIVLPPPNVTGILHMGSAFMLGIQDTIVRTARMQGKRTLWIPGTDHAAIATQTVVEKKLDKEEGKRKQDIGREEFVKRVEAFAKESQGTILTQMRGLGASLDWSRTAYTLDEKRSFAVRTAFKKMHDEGLIFRKNRVINWDPKGQTTISDDELVYEEREATLYTFIYSKDFPIPISTTRPETKFGDTAVAVHPEDERYQQYIDQEFDIDYLGTSLHIKVIADHSVEKEFGTGALGVTPAHSMIDYEIGERHGLPMKQVINEFGKMIVGPEGVKDKKAAEARIATAELLRNAGLMIKEEKVMQNVSTAERSGGIIEPLPKLQWFVAVNKKIFKGKTLKEMMREAVGDDFINILPERFEKTYFHWIDNLRDWCISRQIWFGHRIPVWYRGDEIYCGIDSPSSADAATAGTWEQDSDTLDTWFSSGLWPFSTLGWPEKTDDLKNYFPNTFLETGYDIIFFWVARMVLMSSYLMDETPFKTVYLHGLVRDSKGKKISKSLGNNIDPLDMIEKFGADAVRMSLIVGTAPGADSKISEEKLKAYKNFANKLWNIARFVISNTEDFDMDARPSLNAKNQEVLSELSKIANEITEDIDAYRLHLSAEKLYHYIWHTFADVILEDCKKDILNGGVEKMESQYVLITVFYTALKLLHPFMPFVTEEIWLSLPEKFKSDGDKEFIMISPWPVKR